MVRLVGGLRVFRSRMGLDGVCWDDRPSATRGEGKLGLFGVQDVDDVYSTDGQVERMQQ